MSDLTQAQMDEIQAEKERLERLGRDRYAQYQRLQESRYGFVDWRFWTGLLMLAAGGAAIYFRPDVGNFRRELGSRTKRVGGKVRGVGQSAKSLVGR